MHSICENLKPNRYEIMFLQKLKSANITANAFTVVVPWMFVLPKFDCILNEIHTTMPNVTKGPSSKW